MNDTVETPLSAPVRAGWWTVLAGVCVSRTEEFHLQWRLAILAGGPIFAHDNRVHRWLFSLTAARELMKAAGPRIVGVGPAGR